MPAVSEKKVEDFPKRDELINTFVTHNVAALEIEPPSKEWPTGKRNVDLNGWQFDVDIVNNVCKKELAVTEESVIKTLGEIGFKDKVLGVNMTAAADMNHPITTCSGGWKVEMQLACVQLVNAVFLMIDDPTSHVDVKNSQWVKNWLGNFKGEKGKVLEQLVELYPENLSSATRTRNGCSPCQDPLRVLNHAARPS